MASPATSPNASPRLLRWRGRTQVFMERCGGLELAMVRIPAGEFVMGSPPEEPERLVDEGPQRRVTLGEFLMDRTPITQAQWRLVARWEPPVGERWQRELDPEPSHFRLMGRTGSMKPPQASRRPQDEPAGATGDGSLLDGVLLDGEETSDQRPVERVSWHDAMEFCRRLNRRLGPATGRFYTLPSEAQWEYACRAGTTTPFAFGETLTTELANYNGTLTYANGPEGEWRFQTTPVGMFPANAWGLHDMHGNVWEWCLDEWHGRDEEAPVDGSAWLKAGEAKPKQNANEGEESNLETRLLRGGSWFNLPGDCRSAYRDHGGPDDAFGLVGFRVVCLPQGPSLHP